MITDKINNLIADALKNKDELRLSTLRLLSSALNYERIAKQHPLSDEEELIVVRREVKKRKDAIEALEQAKNKQTGHTAEDIDQRIKKEKDELDILKVYLPPEMDKQELEKIVDDAIKTLGATSMKEFGKVMGFVMNKTKGSVSGEVVSELVKSKLTA